MPFEVKRVNHPCKTCKNETTFRTPTGYFCRNCLEVEQYADSEKPEPETKVEIMPDTMIENVKQDEQINEIQEAINEEKPSQQSIEEVTEESQ